jgi:sugar phosphate permease
MNTAKQFGGAIGLAAATAAAAIAGTDRVAFVFMSVTLLAVIATAAAIPAHRSKPQTEKTTGRAS